jgi:hypothetical protein
MKTQRTKIQTIKTQSSRSGSAGLRELLLTLAPAVLAVVAVVLLFVLPYATYQYKQKTYAILGRSFLFGTGIAGGKHEVGQSTVLWIFAIAMAVVLVAALVKIGKKVISDEIMTVAGIAGLVASAFMASNVGSMLDGVKKTAASSGAIASIILSILIIACGLFSLREHQILCSPGFHDSSGLYLFHHQQLRPDVRNLHRLQEDRLFQGTVGKRLGRI